MSRRTRTYRRDEIYEQVWSATMRDVARRYAISDVAMKKVCKKLAVPTPPQGHWNKVAAGHDVVKVKLPPLPKHTPDELEVVWYQNDDEVQGATPAAIERAETLRRSGELIEVKSELVDPHKLVARSAKILARAKPNDGRVSSIDGGLDILVAPASVPRALCLMDALLKALEHRGFAVEITGPREEQQWGRPVVYPSLTRVRVDDEWVAFELSEHVDVAPPPPEPPKPRRELTWQERLREPYQAPQRRLRTPNGSLRLSITSGHKARHWRDRRSKKVETALTEFVAHLHIVADWLKQKRALDEQRERERQEEERLRREEAAREAKQREKVKNLDEFLERWRRCKDIREFASQIRGMVKAHTGKLTEQGELQQYVAWMLKYADDIDPLRGVRARLLQPASR
jgi:hypothetical protein